jgi:hypothetical protein
MPSPQGDPLMSTFWSDVTGELTRAREAHAPLNSAHEGLAVIQEEVFELQQEVYKKREQRDRHAMYAELVQIAAMAWRMATDILPEIGDDNLPAQLEFPLGEDAPDDWVRPF